MKAEGLKDYYKILRVNRQASRDEIRRSYRRLAVVFHPDKNRSAQAIALFQEINEAHEVLSDPDKRSRYDELLNGVFVVSTPAPQQPWHRDPAYRRSHPPGFKPPPRQPSERLLLMVHLLRYLRRISLIGLGWCVLLIIDYSLPFNISIEKVLPEAYRVIAWQFTHVPNVIVTEKGHQFPVSFEGVEFFPVGSNVKVITSRILNVLVKIENQDKSFTIDNLPSIYQNFVVAPLILLVLSLLGLFLKNGIEFRFNVGVSICIVLLFNVIFLIFSVL